MEFGLSSSWVSGKKLWNVGKIAVFLLLLVSSIFFVTNQLEIYIYNRNEVHSACELCSLYNEQLKMCVSGMGYYRGDDGELIIINLPE